MITCKALFLSSFQTNGLFSYTCWLMSFEDVYPIFHSLWTFTPERLEKLSHVFWVLFEPPKMKTNVTEEVIDGLYRHMVNILRNAKWWRCQRLMGDEDMYYRTGIDHSINHAGVHIVAYFVFPNNINFSFLVFHIVFVCVLKPK